ncbi:serine hydrolase domain-containing protein [Paenibacillus sp. Marseille-Q4541]|uniref:serine hydrolase domain-containing protein n=1 Tax=Paenibacillus sp. Marseille-Q4541 TaxID=2831522 RepID=UPI001BAB969C|nr:serine hydrolase domain-containing protein [Paenibacillus sp. Marseille-Q4541]
MRNQSSEFDRIYHYIEQNVVNKKWPSAVFGITDREQLLDLRSYGTYEDGREINSSSIFPVFSITKPMIGLAIMQLWEKGLLHPGQLVSEVLPEFAENGKDKLAVWHLLTHTGGLDQRYAMEWAQGKHDPDGMGHPKLYAALKASQLETAPGKEVSYNNMAFTVLAEMIERLSGVTYEEYLKQHIFEPLGMKDTGFGGSHQDEFRIAPIAGGEAMKDQMDALVAAKVPSGGLFSTADDLLLFAKAMLRQTEYKEGQYLIEPSTFKQMITPQTLHIEEVESDYGFVWKLPIRHKGFIERDIFGHNGMGGCMVWMYPKQDVAFVLMTAALGKPVDNIHVHNVFTASLR